MRGFEIFSGFENRGIILPARRTAFSAGYDLRAADDVLISGKKISLVPTGLKVFMPADEVLLIYIRSSLAVKGLLLANGVGVIDADYRGQILIPLTGLGGDFEIKKDMRIAQGIFQKYFTVAGDEIGVGNERQGGFGSTGNF